VSNQSSPRPIRNWLFEINQSNSSYVSKSNTDRLKRAFNAPYYDGSYDRRKATEIFQSILDAENFNDGGNFFNDISMNFKNSPSFESVKENLNQVKSPPASPWVPNPNSPRDASNPSTDPLKKDPAPDYYLNLNPENTSAPFSGPGSNLSPKSSASSISQQNLFNILNLGSSKP
jgi:hypothetical protein